MKTEIVIKSTQNKPAAYFVTIEFMFGDADGKAFEGVEICPEDFTLDSTSVLLATIQGLTKAYPNGRGGCDDYGQLGNKYYDAFIGDLGLENLEINPQEIYLSHPSDPSNHGESSIKDFKVEYRDIMGCIHPVKVIFDTPKEQEIIKYNAEFY